MFYNNLLIYFMKCIPKLIFYYYLFFLIIGVFFKDLMMSIWGGRQILTRCTDPGRVTNTVIPGINSPIKAYTPVKKNVLKSMYIYKHYRSKVCKTLKSLTILGDF